MRLLHALIVVSSLLTLITANNDVVLSNFHLKAIGDNIANLPTNLVSFQGIASKKRSDEIDLRKRIPQPMSSQQLQFSSGSNIFSLDETTGVLTTGGLSIQGDINYGLFVSFSTSSGFGVTSGTSGRLLTFDDGSGPQSTFSACSNGGSFFIYLSSKDGETCDDIQLLLVFPEQSTSSSEQSGTLTVDESPTSIAASTSSVPVDSYITGFYLEALGDDIDDLPTTLVSFRDFPTKRNDIRSISVQLLSFLYAPKQFNLDLTTGVLSFGQYYIQADTAIGVYASTNEGSGFGVQSTEQGNILTHDSGGGPQSTFWVCNNNNEFDIFLVAQGGLTCNSIQLLLTFELPSTSSIDSTSTNQEDSSSASDVSVTFSSDSKSSSLTSSDISSDGSSVPSDVYLTDFYLEAIGNDIDNLPYTFADFVVLSKRDKGGPLGPMIMPLSFSSNFRQFTLDLTSGILNSNGYIMQADISNGIYATDSQTSEAPHFGVHSIDKGNVLTYDSGSGPQYSFWACSNGNSFNIGLTSIDGSICDSIELLLVFQLSSPSSVEEDVSSVPSISSRSSDDVQLPSSSSIDSTTVSGSLESSSAAESPLTSWVSSSQADLSTSISSTEVSTSSSSVPDTYLSNFYLEAIGQDVDLLPTKLLSSDSYSKKRETMIQLMFRNGYTPFTLDITTGSLSFEVSFIVHASLDYGFFGSFSEGSGFGIQAVAEGNILTYDDGKGPQSTFWACGNGGTYYLDLTSNNNSVCIKLELLLVFQLPSNSPIETASETAVYSSSDIEISSSFAVSSSSISSLGTDLYSLSTETAASVSSGPPDIYLSDFYLEAIGDSADNIPNRWVSCDGIQKRRDLKVEKRKEDTKLMYFSTGPRQFTLDLTTGILELNQFQLFLQADPDLGFYATNFAESRFGVQLTDEGNILTFDNGTGPSSTFWGCSTGSRFYVGIDSIEGEECYSVYLLLVFPATSSSSTEMTTSSDIVNSSSAVIDTSTGASSSYTGTNSVSSTEVSVSSSSVPDTYLSNFYLEAIGQDVDHLPSKLLSSDGYQKKRDTKIPLFFRSGYRIFTLDITSGNLAMDGFFVHADSDNGVFASFTQGTGFGIQVISEGNILTYDNGTGPQSTFWACSNGGTYYLGLVSDDNFFCISLQLLLVFQLPTSSSVEVSSTDGSSSLSDTALTSSQSQKVEFPTSSSSDDGSYSNPTQSSSLSSVWSSPSVDSLDMSPSISLLDSSSSSITSEILSSSLSSFQSSSISSPISSTIASSTYSSSYSSQESSSASFSLLSDSAVSSPPIVSISNSIILSSESSLGSQSNTNPTGTSEFLSSIISSSSTLSLSSSESSVMGSSLIATSGDISGSLSLESSTPSLFSPSSTPIETVTFPSSTDSSTLSNSLSWFSSSILSSPFSSSSVTTSSSSSIESSNLTENPSMMPTDISVADDSSSSAASITVISNSISNQSKMSTESSSSSSSLGSSSGSSLHSSSSPSSSSSLTGSSSISSPSPSSSSRSNLISGSSLISSPSPSSSSSSSLISSSSPISSLTGSSLISSPSPSSSSSSISSSSSRSSLTGSSLHSSSSPSSSSSLTGSSSISSPSPCPNSNSSLLSNSFTSGSSSLISSTILNLNSFSQESAESPYPSSSASSNSGSASLRDVSSGIHISSVVSTSVASSNVSVPLNPLSSTLSSSSVEVSSLISQTATTTTFNFQITAIANPPETFHEFLSFNAKNITLVDVNAPLFQLILPDGFLKIDGLFVHADDMGGFYLSERPFGGWSFIGDPILELENVGHDFYICTKQAVPLQVASVAPDCIQGELHIYDTESNTSVPVATETTSIESIPAFETTSSLDNTSFLGSIVTATVTSNEVITLTECPSSVSNCPARSTKVITIEHTLITTYCPNSANSEPTLPNNISPNTSLVEFNPSKTQSTSSNHRESKLYGSLTETTLVATVYTSSEAATITLFHSDVPNCPAKPIEERVSCRAVHSYRYSETTTLVGVASEEKDVTKTSIVPVTAKTAGLGTKSITDGNSVTTANPTNGSSPGALTRQILQSEGDTDIVLSSQPTSSLKQNGGSTATELVTTSPVGSLQSSSQFTSETAIAAIANNADKVVGRLAPFVLGLCILFL
ncbi:uncharacterized protein RJT20DRAFT_10097 [Scheffersomyces xylosifermentans]|uniref:uncharacterized protein n=1 Tax=Scheffersomyces xylosifermentans TaxID=1304137 RepID=UPI00315D5FD0